MNRLAKGFTLIELMIAITLGMLVVAAGLSIYLSGQRSSSLQQGMSELQQNALFGLSVLTHDLRHINLNTVSVQKINNKTVGSGIVFSTENLPSSLSETNVGYLTKQDMVSGGTNEFSDQLLVQYMPQYSTSSTIESVDDVETQTVTTSSTMIDCEGRLINHSISAEGGEPSALMPVYVQRYYLSEMKRDGVSYSPKKYALYCDAGYYNSGDTSIQGLGSSGQQIMQNIDVFKVKLGVKTVESTLRYMTIDEYVELNNAVAESDNYYQVVSIEVAVLAKSTNPVGGNADIDDEQSFYLFGDSSSDSYGRVTLKDEQKTSSKYLRQVFSQVVAIRNTLGAVL